MASYHMSIKTGRRGSANAHANYIFRNGKHRMSASETDLKSAEFGNIPQWAQDDPFRFWKAADKYERKNGAVYREMQLALPRELDTDQQLELVREWVKAELPGKTYQFAIHNPPAAVAGGDQPHVHLMFSDRVQDGLQRPEDQYFRRYNPERPDMGGCRKDSGGKTRSELRDNLKDQRKRWAQMQNETLDRHGFDARVDSRSNEARGVWRQPETRLGPAGTRHLSETDKQLIQDLRARSRES